MAEATAKAVIFDLFETLITEWGHEKYTKRMMCEDLHVPEAEFSELWESLHEKQYRGGITFEESLRWVCGKLGVSADERLIGRMTKRRKETKAVCFDFLHPEVIPMLRELRGRGCKLCILSNCSDEEVGMIRSSVLAPLFDAMVLSHETGLCKPEKAIYDLAAEKLGVNNEDCVFIGDGGSRELYGAAQAGMKPYRAMWYIRQMPFPVKEQPEFAVLDEPADVLRILASDKKTGEETDS